MDVSDSDLMTRLTAGDDLALNEIMNRWSTRVVSFLFRLTGSQDAAIDLAQETFVKLYQTRTRYHLDGNFSTWLFAIAANLARNHARWKARHPNVSLDAPAQDGGFSFTETIDPSASPSEAAQSHEQAAAVHKAILALPMDLRETLTLFVHEGLSYAEIAKLSKCSPKAIETRIYRARQILKAKLVEQ